MAASTYKLVNGNLPTPETKIKKLVKEFLILGGWFVRHNMQRRWSYKGMPDIIVTHHGITLEIEFKSKTGKQSPDQIRYQADLEEHGGHYVLARSFEDIAEYLKENNL